jgi:hypothetical protein
VDRGAAVLAGSVQAGDHLVLSVLVRDRLGRTNK